MEQVFFRIHLRVAKTAHSIFSRGGRKLVEVLSIVNALLVWSLIVWLHKSYVPVGKHANDVSCLHNSVHRDAPKIENCHADVCGEANVWKFHLSTGLYDKINGHGVHIDNDYGCKEVLIKDLFRENLYTRMGLFYDDNAEQGLFESSRSSQQEIASSGLHSSFNDTNKYTAPLHCLDGDMDHIASYKRRLLQAPLTSVLSASDLTVEIGSVYSLAQLFQDQYVYLYSRHKSLLSLRPEVRGAHGVVMQHVGVSQEDETCFGSNRVLTAVLHEAVGYDIVMRNLVMSAYESNGYLYSVTSKQMTNLNNYKELRELEYPRVSASNVFVTLFLYFVASSLVSLTLRSTQEKMLKFAYLLQHQIRNRLPYFNLVFTHCLESLVFVPIMIGMHYFLVEFYHDHLLSFLIVTMIWISEVYTALCVRTKPTHVVFPKLVMIYFFIFNVYCENFHYGYPYLALFGTYLLIVHAIFFCYNNYELPALENGEINALAPRYWINIDIYEVENTAKKRMNLLPTKLILFGTLGVLD